MLKSMGKYGGMNTYQKNIDSWTGLNVLVGCTLGST